MIDKIAKSNRAKKEGSSSEALAGSFFGKCYDELRGH